jgi:hypothetical protein
MARDFTDDDVGSNVLDAEGNRLGQVRQAHGDHATVESTNEEREGLTDKLKDYLGWGDSNENDLSSEQVDSYGNNEVRLRDHR